LYHDETLQNKDVKHATESGKLNVLLLFLSEWMIQFTAANSHHQPGKYNKIT